MNKKFIACALAAMMLASLAIPAAAADTNIDNNDGGKSTKVVLNYGKDIPTGPEGAFTITVPANMDMDATSNGDAGATFTNPKDSNPQIVFNGMIGQNERVDLNITSANSYYLMDGNTAVAGYKIDFTTDENNGIDIQTSQVKTNDGTKTISWNYAKAFNGKSAINMTFNNDGSNTIFGKGTYKDTLTFDYTYVSDKSIVTDSITGARGNVTIDFNGNGNVVADSLSSYALGFNADDNYTVKLEVTGAATYTCDYICTIKDGKVVSSSSNESGNFNYKELNGTYNLKVSAIRENAPYGYCSASYYSDIYTTIPPTQE